MESNRGKALFTRVPDVESNYGTGNIHSLHFADAIAGEGLN